MSKTAMMVWGMIGIVCFSLLMSLDAWNGYRILSVLAARGTADVIFLYAFPLLASILLIVAAVLRHGDN